MLSESVANNLKPNGKLIVSGIILDKMQLVKDTYEKLGYKTLETTIQGEWACYVFEL